MACGFCHLKRPHLSLNSSNKTNMYQNNLIHIMAEKGKKKIKVSVQSQDNRVLIKDNLTNIYIFVSFHKDSAFGKIKRVLER